MLSTHLRHLPEPRSRPQSPATRRENPEPPARPAPSAPAPHPAPTRAAGAPASPGPTPPASTQVLLRSPAAARGGPSWHSLCPITPRRLPGLPAPGNRGETRPGPPARATLAPAATPRGSACGAPHPRVATCPAPSPHGSAGPERARAGLPSRRPAAAASPAAGSSFSAARTQPLPGARKHRLRGLGALGRAGRGTCSPGGRRRRRRSLCACAASRAGSRGAPRAARGNGRERELAAARLLRGGRPCGRRVA